MIAAQIDLHDCFDLAKINPSTYQVCLFDFSLELETLIRCDFILTDCSEKQSKENSASRQNLEALFMAC